MGGRYEERRGWERERETRGAGRTAASSGAIIRHILFRGFVVDRLLCR